MRLAKFDQEKWESLVDPVEAATDSHIGRIFEFAFKDAISGEMVTSANFGPCDSNRHLGDLVPALRRSDATHEGALQQIRAQGVVFVGVSLDDPSRQGLEKLLNFVSQYEIPWAQYHQPNSELSKAWDVSAIPTIFVVDRDGRIVTKRGDLDDVIPKLLLKDAKSQKSSLTVQGKTGKK